MDLIIYLKLESGIDFFIILFFNHVNACSADHSSKTILKYF